MVRGVFVAVVGLHEARVVDARDGGRFAHPDAAVRFLQDGGQDEAVVDEGGGGAVLDCRVDVFHELGAEGGLVSMEFFFRTDFVLVLIFLFPPSLQYLFKFL